MISMAEKMYIKQLYEDGVSKSEIQRRTKLNYRTVCKYADMEDWNDDKLPNMEPDNYPVLGEYIGGVPARIRFYHDHALVASYRRCYGKNEELMDWTQYVRTLCRKPGAAEHTRFFSAMPLPWQSYLSQTRGQERKSALQLLDDIVVHLGMNNIQTRQIDENAYLYDLVKE